MNDCGFRAETKVGRIDETVRRKQFLFQAVQGVCILYMFYPSTLAMKLTGVAVFCLLLIIPVAILIAVYGRIAWFLSKQMNTDLLNNTKLENKSKMPEETTAKVSNPAAELRQKNFELARRNTIKTLLLVAIFFVLCWTGNQIWLLMFSLGTEMNWDSPVYQFFVLMICVNCVINPIIYLIQYRDYQKALRNLLCKKQKHIDDFSDMSQSSNTVVSEVRQERSGISKN